jgi:hypothetical protein
MEAEPFEYLASLVCADLRLLCGLCSPDHLRGPLGRFLRDRGQNSMMEITERELRAQGEAWPPLRAKLFDSLQRLRLVKKTLDDFFKASL